MDLKKLLIRTGSGAVYVALMILGTFFPDVMSVTLCVASIICIHEFCKMCSGPADRLSEFLLGLVSYVLFVVIVFTYNPYMYDSIPGGMILNFIIMFPALLVIYTMIMATVEMFRKRPCPIEQIGKGVFGMLWIILPLGMLAATTCSFPKMVLMFLLLVWANDTFAYLGGSMYGKHKMFERISPKKTWEGTLTGAFFTFVVAFICSKIPYFYENSVLYKPFLWFLFAALVVVFGTVGDLLESLFKRSAGLKDSGNIMPGHGGMLDRFDSILFAAIPVCLLLFGIYCSGF